MEIVVCNKLGRWYQDVLGLNDLTLTISPGITGLVGPNGAGKTTLLRLLAGELRPSAGSVKVLGYTPFANSSLYARLGICPQSEALYDDISGIQFVSNLLQLSGYSQKEAMLRACEVMEMVGMESSMHRKCGEYSKGMRKLTRLAQAIAHRPELLLLDEPFSGLDPLARHRMMKMLKALAEEGISIVLSSHILHEVEQLSDSVILLHKGRLLARGDVRDIRHLLSKHPHRVSIRAQEPRRLALGLLALDHVQTLSFGKDGVRFFVETNNVEALYQAMPTIVSEAAAGIKSMVSSDDDLESVFDYLMEGKQ